LRVVKTRREVGDKALLPKIDDEFDGESQWVETNLLVEET
jgi:hypothetical protein